MKKVTIPIIVFVLVFAITACFLLLNRNSAKTTAITTPTTVSATNGSTVVTLTNTITNTSIITAFPEIIGFTDTLADWFDYTGTSVKGQEYLDIVSSEIVSSGDVYSLRIKVNGSVPDETAGDDTYIEWDLLLDTDQDPNTGSYWPLISNDIGYDYMARAGMKGSDQYFELLDVQTNQFTALQGQITGDSIFIILPNSIIGFVPEIRWAAAVRRYLNTDGSGSPSLCDKAPNNGHYLYPAQISGATIDTKVTASDPVGDLKDKNGSPTTGSDCMDITGVEMIRSGDWYTATISVKGDIPAAVSGEESCLEWDLFIDTDCDPATGSIYYAFANDLGYETLIRACLDQWGWHGQIINISTNSLTRTYLKRENNSFEIEFPAGEIGNPDCFTWTALFRLYKDNASADDPAILDKAPLSGHWEFGGEEVSPDAINNYSDSAGDLYNNYHVTTGADYLDITEASLRRAGDTYTAIITLESDIPAFTAEKDTFLEWDIFLDTGNYIEPGPGWPFITSGEELDYLVRVSLKNAQIIGELIYIPTETHYAVYFTVTDNMIKIEFPADLIGNPAEFHWVALTRVYPSGALASSPAAYDKAPDKQYYIFPYDSEK